MVQHACPFQVLWMLARCPFPSGTVSLLAHGRPCGVCARAYAECLALPGLCVELGADAGGCPRTGCFPAHDGRLMDLLEEAASSVLPGACLAAVFVSEFDLRFLRRAGQWCSRRRVASA
ncbi:unnamed protein product [Polarella glacialis]|uniref:Uncharacterized protein n=1 Tax=Polarella glacialis TaxID=89957 RepID=A0A813HIY5_POLGL|nr:unnamed protein product [Polarella glacialis]